MKRVTISDIVAMESAKNEINEASFKKLKLHRKKNNAIATEGLFDFFRKKKDDEKKKKPNDPTEQLKELQEANRVSIALRTTSVEEEIKYLEDVIKGLPFFRKDMDRVHKCFKFIIDNHSDILNKLDKLVDISYFDSSYNLNNNRSAIEFKYFIVSVRDLAKDKESQMKIGASAEYIDFEEEFDNKLSDDEVKRYSKLYCLNEAIPTIDYILPKNRAPKEQTRVYLEKGDIKLEKLLKLNIDLIEKGKKLFTQSDDEEGYRLSSRADKLTHSKLIGDGDEFGMANIMRQSLLYQYQVTDGAVDEFINNYTAH